MTTKDLITRARRFAQPFRMRAYEDVMRHTATEEAPWYVVPADNKWFTRLVVAAAVVDTLRSLGLRYPKVSKEKQRDLAAAKRALLGGK